MTSTPLVSIVINNYNYGRFLETAIESALDQRWPRLEVIVVDDGSTDDSREVIARFTPKVVAVLKENEGQASTFNAGYARSRGEVVLFLDADDALLPHAVEAAVEPLLDTGVVKVHWPMWEIDEAGRHLGRFHKHTLIEGDASDELVRRGPVSLTQSPTSGNAWARWFLEQVMPLPEHADKHGADGFLKKLCPIYGEIRRLDQPQSLYRVHASNYGGGRGTAFELRRGLRRYPAYCRLLAKHLHKKGIVFDLAAWVGHDSQYAWLRSFALAFDELDALVARGETVVLVDNEDLGDDLLPGRQLVSLQEHNGQDRNLPVDAGQAIARLARLRASEATMLVVAFTGFWWLDSYPELFVHLRTRHRCLVDNDHLLVFDLRGPARTVTGAHNGLHRHTLRDGRPVTEICQAALGREPEQIQPVGKSTNQSRAFKVRLGSETVKCFECHDAQRAQDVRSASAVLHRQEVPVPEVLAVIDHVVVSEWVSGAPLAGGKSNLTRMASYQARLHAASVPSARGSRDWFPHLEWLIERLRRASASHVSASTISELGRQVRALQPRGLKRGIVQPDFIRSNLIVTHADDLIIVDNEFLGIGVGFEFDLLNASRSVAGGDEQRRRRYLDDYAEVGDLGSLEQHSDFWEICYLTKLAGKRFSLGDVEMGTVCLDLLADRVGSYGHATGAD